MENHYVFYTVFTWPNKCNKWSFLIILIIFDDYFGKILRTILDNIFFSWFCVTYIRYKMSKRSKCGNWSFLVVVRTSSYVRRRRRNHFFVKLESAFGGINVECWQNNVQCLELWIIKHVYLPKPAFSSQNVSAAFPTHKKIYTIFHKKKRLETISSFCIQKQYCSFSSFFLWLLIFPEIYSLLFQGGFPLPSKKV